MGCRLTVDHKGSDPDERERILLLGGFVTEKGRVMGDLAVSRSFGDIASAPYIISRPFVQETVIGEGDDFLVLGCDGIFDVFTDQQVVDLVSSVPPEYASIILRDYAYLAGSNDNLTAIVVYFKR